MQFLNSGHHFCVVETGNTLEFWNKLIQSKGASRKNYGLVCQKNWNCLLGYSRQWIGQSLYCVQRVKIFSNFPGTVLGFKSSLCKIRWKDREIQTLSKIMAPKNSRQNTESFDSCLVTSVFLSLILVERNWRVAQNKICLWCSFQPNISLQKKMAKNTEAANILVGRVDFIEKPIIAFARLAQAEKLTELTEVSWNRSHTKGVDALWLSPQIYSMLWNTQAGFLWNIIINWDVCVTKELEHTQPNQHLKPSNSCNCLEKNSENHKNTRTWAKTWCAQQLNSKNTPFGKTDFYKPTRTKQEALPGLKGRCKPA